MKLILNLLLVVPLLFGCNTEKDRPYQNIEAIRPNMTEENVNHYKWLNDPQSYEIIDNSLVVTVTKGTDYFNNPEDNSVIASAPYMYQSINGDFVAKALIQPDFSSQWNAVALMVYFDNQNWIKFAFENSDATGTSIVSVVTKGTSDDANGVVINDLDQVWLAIAKKNNIFSMHWSKDGENYKMARLTKMTGTENVKIGIEFQSPVGEKATHTVHYFETELRTIENLRLLNSP